MRFSVKNVLKSKIRLGKLTEISRLPGFEAETPLLLFYTKGGSVPHMSREVLEYLTKEQISIQVPLPTTVQCVEGTQAMDTGISEFVGLKDMLTYCTVQDPCAIIRENSNTKNDISIWSHRGKISLDVSGFMDIIETFRPDFYQAMSHGDTDENSSKKKIGKVMEYTHKFFEQCLEMHQSSSALADTSIFGSIEGGYDVDSRTKSSKFMSTKDVSGFVINGICTNGPEIEEINFEKVVPILKAALSHLPEDKPRVVHGCWRPENILKMVEIGIDMFDSSLAYLTTERMSAFLFQYDEVPIESEKPELLDGSDNTLEICLKDKSCKEDFGPILEGCNCLTCQNHTRAYIHHLIMNKELVAKTLLMLHNLHHYMLFFKSIRTAAASGKKLSIKRS